MTIRFTMHVKRRMVERGILEWQVRAAVSAPVSVHATPDGSLCYVAVFGGRVLKVWVVDPPEADNLFVIKSAAWKGE